LRLVPNSSLPEPFATSFAYISIGLIFGALHAVVRPAILFLTGRLYIWSMGLLALATDVFIFLLLSYLAPAVWQVGGARLFSALLGAMLLGVIVMGLEAASTAQVHAATLHSGERVVVKVRRPDIEVTVKGDLNVIQDVLKLVERRASWSRRFGLSALFQGRNHRP
jgi:uncharacterized membrane protein YvlD (DUF360 family)